MKKYLVVALISFYWAEPMYAQNAGDKKTAKQVLDELPEMLIAPPDATVDTNANKLINDNLSMVIPPVWREKGVHSLIDFKLAKTDKEPVNATFPSPVRTQNFVITLNTVKKTPEERKQITLNSVKAHLATYYKETQTTLNSAELTAKLNTLVTGPEKFTTAQGKTGDLYVIQDVEVNQSNFIVLLLITADKVGYTHVIQFTYTRFTYETIFPEDILELKTFLYGEDEDNYLNFTKRLMHTFWVK